MRTRNFFKATARKQKKSHRQKEIAGLSLAGVGVLFFYCALFPAGLWGTRIQGVLDWVFGVGRYLFPLWLAYVGYRIAIPKPWSQVVLRLTLWAGFFFFFGTLTTLLSEAAWKENSGGALGQVGALFFSRLLGKPGGWIVSLFGLGGILCALFRVSPVELGEKLLERLKGDLREWKQARQKPLPQKAPIVAPRPLRPVEGPPLKPQISSRQSQQASSKDSSRSTLPEHSKTTKAPPAEKKQEKNPAIKKPTPPSASPTERPAKKVSSVSQPTPPPASLSTEKEEKPPYVLPALDLLNPPVGTSAQQTEQALLKKAELLTQTLANFSVTATVTDIHPGPVITRFDLQPAPGVKISSIVTLGDDIALAMRATRVRVLAPIPGKGAVGIEIPNDESVTVTLREILEDARFAKIKSVLGMGLGKTASGKPYVTDLAPMPHLLVAGATGAGKSVCIHTLIMSILFRASPDRVKFLLIDPKRLELPVYNGLPHLYDPRLGPESAQVITQPKEAAKALVRMVRVMEHRYEIFAKANVRNIEGFNAKQESQGLPPEYYIVVVIDELADLMLVASREVEDSIQRLAQMARAVGIHLILATQRPSVDVITGVIKANLPARIALRVASQTDSRVILDTTGAESLVGAGDMLFLPAGAPAPIRIQGAYVSSSEVDRVVAFCGQQGKPEYEDVFKVLAAQEAAKEDAETQTQLKDALTLIKTRKRVSQDLLKAHFGSSAKATNILSLLEVHEFINKPEGTNRWEIHFDKIEDYLRALGEKTGVSS